MVPRRVYLLSEKVTYDGYGVRCLDEEVSRTVCGRYNDTQGDVTPVKKARGLQRNISAPFTCPRDNLKVVENLF